MYKRLIMALIAGCFAFYFAKPLVRYATGCPIISGEHQVHLEVAKDNLGISPKIATVRELHAEGARTTIIHVMMVHMADPLDMSIKNDSAVEKLVRECSSQCYEILERLKEKTGERKLFMDGLTPEFEPTIDNLVSIARANRNKMKTNPAVILESRNAALKHAFEDNYDIEAMEDQKLIDECQEAIDKSNGVYDGAIIRSFTRRNEHIFNELKKSPGNKILYLGAAHRLSKNVAIWNTNNPDNKIRLIEITPRCLPYDLKQLMTIFERIDWATQKLVRQGFLTFLSAFSVVYCLFFSFEKKPKKISRQQKRKIRREKR